MMTDLAYEFDERDAPEEQPQAENLAQLRPIPRITIQAFCETEGVSRTLERAADDRRMARAHVTVIGGGLDKAVELYSGSPTPNLIVLETRLEPSRLVSELGRLAEVCDPTTKLVIVGHHNDVSLYRELVRSGVSEYVVAPVSMADIIGVIASIFIDPDAEPLGRSFAFIGAKGGVGSSTIAHNVAWAISSLFSTETILADLDLAFGTANIDFDQDPPQGIAEAVFSPDRVDEVFLDRLLAKCSDHLSMLAAPSMLDRTYDFDERAFSSILDVVRRNAPIVVLDMPHVWTAWEKKTLAESDEVVITAAPDLANLRNAKNLIDTLTKLRPNDPAPRLILNQVGVAKRPEIDPAAFHEALGIEAIAIIPFDAHLFGSAANSGRMIAETDPRSATAETLSQIAHILTGRTELKKRKGKGLSSILSKLARK